MNIDRFRMNGLSGIGVPEKSPTRKPSSARLASTKMRSRFIAAMPLGWVACAAKLPGKAFAVAVAIRYLSGVKKNRTILISPTILDEFGVKRHASYRALSELERKGLISVERKRGRAAIITICDVPLQTRCETDETEKFGEAAALQGVATEVMS